MTSEVKSILERETESRSIAKSLYSNLPFLAEFTEAHSKASQTPNHLLINSKSCYTLKYFNCKFILNNHKCTTALVMSKYG